MGESCGQHGGSAQGHTGGALRPDVGRPIHTLKEAFADKCKLRLPGGGACSWHPAGSLAAVRNDPISSREEEVQFCPGSVTDG